MVAYLFLLEIITSIARTIITAIEPILQDIVTICVGAIAQVVWTLYIKFIFEPFMQTTCSAFLEHGIDAAMSFGFVDVLYSRVRVIGMAVFILMVAFQLFKSLFAYTGIEADDPLNVGFRAIAYGFLIYYSKDVCALGLNIFVSLMKYLLGTDSISQMIGRIANMMIGTQILSITGICLAYLSFKLIMVTFRFAERYVIMLFLVIMAPLAFATGASKITNKAMQGWIKVFTGNLVVQLCQLVIMLAITRFFSDSEDLNVWTRIMPPASGDVVDLRPLILPAIFMLAMVKVLEKLEQIVREAQVGVSGSGGGALRNPVSAGMDMLINQNPLIQLEETVFTASKDINYAVSFGKNILGLDPSKLGSSRNPGGGNSSVGPP